MKAIREHDESKMAEALKKQEMAEDVVEEIRVMGAKK